jgi:23S rRNA (guanine745-N1)-methyltransferase
MAEHIEESTVFSCPHCSAELKLARHGAHCMNGHSFDRSREGYINLIIGGRLPTGATSGDTHESLLARRRFFATHSYMPVATALNDALGVINGPVLDVGCGEGYYLDNLIAADKYGIDISKKAVQLASKLIPTARCAVASAFRLPVLDHSCAAVFSVFAPHSFEEIQRVLLPGGTWVTVTPGPRHLHQMRPHRDQAIIEREERRSEPPIQAQHAERIQCDLDLSVEAAHDLFSMTPLVWQTAANAAPSTHVSVDVWVSRGTTS